MALKCQKNQLVVFLGLYSGNATFRGETRVIEEKAFRKVTELMFSYSKYVKTVCYKVSY